MGPFTSDEEQQEGRNLSREVCDLICELSYLLPPFNENAAGAAADDEISSAAADGRVDSTNYRLRTLFFSALVEASGRAAEAAAGALWAHLSEADDLLIEKSTRVIYMALTEAAVGGEVELKWARMSRRVRGL